MYIFLILPVYVLFVFILILTTFLSHEGPLTIHLSFPDVSLSFRVLASTTFNLFCSLSDFVMSCVPFIFLNWLCSGACLSLDKFFINICFPSMSDNVTLTGRDLSVFSSAVFLSPLFLLLSRTTFFMIPTSTLTNSHNSTIMLVSSLFLSIASVSWDSLIPWIIMFFFSLCTFSDFRNFAIYWCYNVIITSLLRFTLVIALYNIDYHRLYLYV